MRNFLQLPCTKQSPTYRAALPKEIASYLAMTREEK
jgi:hypothetical protein